MIESLDAFVASYFCISLTSLLRLDRSLSTSESLLTKFCYT